MKKIEIYIQGKPANEPVKITITVGEKNYSEVKLYYPKADGKPIVVPKKPWYIYYYYRSPFTGLMVKFMDTCRINRYKTAEERMEAGKAWVKAQTYLLDQGFNPFDKHGIEPKEQPKSFGNLNHSVRSALQHAYDNKLGSWKKATADDYRTRLGVFMEFAEINGIDALDIRELKDIHVIAFLNWLINPKGRNIGMTSQDNYKRALSGLLGKLVKDRIISRNPAAEIDTKKSQPIKNTPFTGPEVLQFREWLLQNDLELYRFIMLVIYVFLRPREIVRLTVKDVKLGQKYLVADTKTNRQKTKKLIAPVVAMFQEMNLDAFPEKAHIFTNTGNIEIWDSEEKSKVDHFGYRFRQAKNALGFNGDYGIYSFRHTAALDLYHAFVKEGCNDHEAVLKLMPIIGHEDPKTTRNYLRDIGGMLPKDYGAMFTLNF